VLLFGRDPERLITGAFVKIGFFRTNADLLYHDEVHGHLLRQVEQTLDLLLTKYLRAGIRYEGLQRVEEIPVPESALREALINAIAHKDYATAHPIQISVYDDKVMIWNPGHLPEGWSMDDLLAKHASRPYNPDVANVFFRAALLEAWGRGIELITAACRAHGAPEPIFRWDAGLWVEFPFALAADASHSSSLGDEDSSPRDKQGKITREDARNRILVLIAAEPAISLDRMAKAIGIGRKAVEYQIVKLKRDGRIRRIGPPRGGRWEVVE